MVQPENHIVAAGLKALREAGAVAIKVHGSAYTRAGEPDIIGSFQGRPFAIEVKQPGEWPSKLQIARLIEWDRAGARVGVATDVWTILQIATRGFYTGWRADPSKNGRGKGAH